MPGAALIFRHVTAVLLPASLPPVKPGGCALRLLRSELSKTS